jgi:hypothetical protein
MIRVWECAEATDRHAVSARSYAHVGHRRQVICVAHAFFVLPPSYRYGILLHELGHLALLKKGIDAHTETDADIAGGELAGVSILRRPYQDQKRIEYVSALELSRARHYVHRQTDYET